MSDLSRKQVEEEIKTYLIKLHAPIALVVVRVGHRTQGAIGVLKGGHALGGVHLHVRREGGKERKEVVSFLLSYIVFFFPRRRKGMKWGRKGGRKDREQHTYQHCLQERAIGHKRPILIQPLHEPLSNQRRIPRHHRSRHTRPSALDRLTLRPRPRRSDIVPRRHQIRFQPPISRGTR